MSIAHPRRLPNALQARMTRIVLLALPLIALLILAVYPRRSELYMHAIYGKRILFDQVACPPQTANTAVLLTLGQSNAANSGEYRHSAGPRVVNFYRGKCFRADDPLLGSEGVHGSVWAMLGDLLSPNFDWVILSPAAVGSTSIGRWNGDLFKRVESRISDLRSRGYHPTHFLWHQGESNAWVTPPDSYAQDLRRLISRTRAEAPGSAFLVASASQCGNARDPGLAKAQRSVVSPANRIYAGPDTDGLTPTDRSDGCHFSRKGQEAVARMWAAAIMAAMEGEPRREPRTQSTLPRN